MSDENVSHSIKKLFGHRAISLQVERVYNESNQVGRSKSMNSFTKIQQNFSAKRDPLSRNSFSLPMIETISASRKTRKSLRNKSLEPTVDNSIKSVPSFNYAEFIPLSNAKIPKGLEDLINTDHLFVSKATDSMEMSVAASNSIKYDVLNHNGTRIYYVHEIPKRKQFCRALFGYSHTFVLLGSTGIEVLRYEGEPKMCGTPASVQIQNKRERFGVVRRISSNSGDIFIIGDGNNNNIFVIKQLKPGVTDYEVYATNGEVLIGRVSKKWGTYLKGKIAAEDIFGVSFTRALDVRMKAILLGALVMMDFNFFENK